MSIEGIGGIGSWPGLQPGGIRPQGPAPDRVGDLAVQRPDPARGGSEAAEVRRAQGSLPADPPQGTDPQLWSVLTSEERVFFARARAMGPLTYGPGSGGGGVAGPSTGGRIDIRI